MKLKFKKSNPLTEGLIWTHASHAIGTDKFIEELDKNKQYLNMKALLHYIDEIVDNLCTGLTEDERSSLREWRRGKGL